MKYSEFYDGLCAALIACGCRIAMRDSSGVQVVTPETEENGFKLRVSIDPEGAGLLDGDTVGVCFDLYAPMDVGVHEGSFRFGCYELVYAESGPLVRYICLYNIQAAPETVAADVRSFAVDAVRYMVSAFPYSFLLDMAFPPSP